jgi:hypothetical protein
MQNTKHIILGIIIFSFIGYYFACKPADFAKPKTYEIKPLEPVIPVVKENTKLTLEQLIETL